MILTSSRLQDAIETIQFTAKEIQAITTTCRQMGGKPSELEKIQQRMRFCTKSIGQQLLMHIP